MILAMVSMLMGCNTANGDDGAVGGDASDLAWEEVTAECPESGEIDITLPEEPFILQVTTCSPVNNGCGEEGWGIIETVVSVYGCSEGHEVRVRYLY